MEKTWGVAENPLRLERGRGKDMACWKKGRGRERMEALSRNRDEECEVAGSGRGWVSKVWLEYGFVS